MKYLLITTLSHSVMTFRTDFIKMLVEKGHQVVVVSQDDVRKDDILSLGVSAFYCAKQDNRGLNPFSILNYKRTLKKIIKLERPDTVLTYMLKPNVFGTVASKKAGVKNIFAAVEGLGDVYINNGIKWKIIRAVVNFLYKKAFKTCNKVFFLNNDDKEKFLSLKLVSSDKIAVLPGTGVNTDRFSPTPIERTDRFIMVARMLKTKGVLEYCECARKVKKMHKDATFYYVGGEGNLTANDIKEYIDDGSIEFIGSVMDVRPYLNQSAVLILPSYREGMPVSVMEAQSSGRAVIVTDCAGSRDTVKDGFNGFIVPIGDVDGLVEKCVWCIAHPQETLSMCQNARDFATVNFDSKRINNIIYSIIE